MRGALVPAAFIFALATGALARDEGSMWWKSQKVPGTNVSCCDVADGSYVEEDIRGGQYWIRFAATNGEWVPVPDEAVIRDPNRHGSPVAWWYFGNSEFDAGHKLIAKAPVKIRCYAPGGGV